MAKDRYLSLVKKFPLKPIRTEDDLDAATAMLDSLTTRELAPDEVDYLEALTVLVRAYESLHFPVEPVPDGQMLQFLIEQSGKSRRQIATETGMALSTINAVIGGKRPLTREQTARLAECFHIAAEAFVSGGTARLPARTSRR